MVHFAASPSVTATDVLGSHCLSSQRHVVVDTAGGHLAYILSMALDALTIVCRCIGVACLVFVLYVHI